MFQLVNLSSGSYIFKEFYSFLKFFIKYLKKSTFILNFTITLYIQYKRIFFTIFMYKYTSLHKQIVSKISPLFTLLQPQFATIMCMWMMMSSFGFTKIIIMNEWEKEYKLLIGTCYKNCRQLNLLTQNKKKNFFFFS